MSFLVLLLLLLLENGSRWRHGVQRDAWLLAALRRVEARGAADWQLPLLLRELVPEYQLTLHHHGDKLEGTVLYAFVDE